MRRNILSRDAQMKMMLSGIAHEIRNPLGGMELFAGILEKEELSDEQRSYVLKIKTEIQHLKVLLNEFLDFARPRTLHRERIAIADLIYEIQTLVSSDVDEKGAFWKVEVQPEAEWIEADRIRLKQALLNLYKNAFQAVPPAGEVRSSICKNGSGIILSIRNTQTTKLDPETQRKVFEPFYTTREKGIGLGLPLAKRIIEAHGGELHLTENEDTHITFSVKLPMLAPPNTLERAERI
jgi:signal transduction histidine kinase